MDPGLAPPRAVRQSAGRPLRRGRCTVARHPAAPAPVAGTAHGGTAPPPRHARLSRASALMSTIARRHRPIAAPTVGRVAALATATLVAATLVAAPAAAQDTPQGIRPYRFTVEPFLTQLWLDDGVGDRETVGGLGARVLFNRSDAAEVTRSLFGRASTGAYLAYTGEQGGVSTLQVGVLAQSSLLAGPAARGVLDPMVSLGIGAFRIDRDGVGAETDLAVTPGIGTRLRIFEGFGLRGDVRVPISFGTNTRAHPTAEGGLYFSF